MDFPLYIVGTSHWIQLGVLTKVAKSRIVAFEQEITSICKTRKIEQILEEASAEALRKCNVKKTVCQRLFSEIPITFVDLDASERFKLGIERDIGLMASMSRARFREGSFLIDRTECINLVEEVRERIWAARALREDKWPALFICGSNHTYRLSRVFDRLGIKNRILHEDFDGA